MDNTPIYGCSGCSTTGGRMSCYQHGVFYLRRIPKHCDCHDCQNNWNEEIKIIEESNYKSVYHK